MVCPDNCPSICDGMLLVSGLPGYGFDRQRWYRRSEWEIRAAYHVVQTIGRRRQRSFVRHTLNIIGGIFVRKWRFIDIGGNAPNLVAPVFKDFAAAPGLPEAR